MSGTPKKTTPREAPTDTTPSEPAVERFNVLDVLATEPAPPVPIRILDVEASVRCEFTGEEAVKFYALVAARDFEGVLELITDAGKAIYQQIGQLNPGSFAKVLNRIIELSTLHEGELLAPLPPFAPRMAGAQGSQGSAAGTS
ncbi:hypothetical protein AAI421_18210 [Rhodococcus aetherivorans]|uniref:hypothetical protein n=1 Tax=Rhodococcus aetherivorans TaxID=191292 RepID=UPI0031E0F17E